MTGKRKAKWQAEKFFVGIPTRALERELERRNSIAYARNVNLEYRAIAARERGERLVKRGKG